jgi:predicted phage terminase large subunit-like protein
MQSADGDWLFLQRFPESWYVHQKSNLGTYGWNSLGQQDPQPRKGNLLRADMVRFLPSDEFDKLTAGARWTRGWDLASKKKERVKSDPDYTVGTRATLHKGIIYVDDVVKGQWNAVKRDKLIVECAKRDGQNTPVCVECVAGYTDAFDYITNLLAGQAIVRPYRPTVDKVARASQFEAKFELGMVVCRKADWNKDWVREVNSFPTAAHDDIVDSFVVALNEMIRMPEGAGITT